MKLLLLLKIMLLVFLCSGSDVERKTNAASILVQATPPLPLSNLLVNPGFENKLEGWTLAKKHDDSKVLVNNVDSSKGEYALFVIKKNKKSSDGVYQSKATFKALPQKGKEYIISCKIKANNDVTNIGGVYCGAGVTLGIYDKSWKKSVRIDARSGESKKWLKLVSKPFVIPDWAMNYQFSAGISHCKGIALIDDISLQKAYTQLTITVSTKSLLQVILRNNKDELVYDSGELPSNTDNFSKTLKVPSTYTYIVKVQNTKGDIFTKQYPLD